MSGDGPDDLPPPLPREPEAWECCQNGCDPCVYDRYWEAFARYEQKLAEWQKRQPPTAYS